MRVREVRAPAFGPFEEGASLEIAPGMTVIYGPNESGKSSWHAAIYAGLCGMRKGKGGGTKADKAFREAHRPWSGSDWAVEVTVQLEDGREVEIRQDLENRTHSQATDGFGRKVTSEILNEGNPDAARWVGLDRNSFLSTACVRQTQVLSVLEDAGQLQEQLQRAADTAGQDETAAQAIAAIEAYRREYVGTTRKNSTKPLRTAIKQEKALADNLGKAKEDHRDYMELSTEAEELARKASKLTDEVTRLATLQAAVRLRHARHRLDRVERLSALFPDGRPPADLEDDDELARMVQEAVVKWKGKPTPIVLEGASASELEKELESLPETPTGDLTPHPSVEAAREELLKAEQSLETFEESRPEAIEPDWDPSLDRERLWDLIRRLETPVPEGDPGMESTVRELEDQARDSQGGVDLVGPIASGVGVLGGLILVVLGTTVAGLTVVGVAAVAGVITLLRLRQRRSARDQLRARLVAEKSKLAAWQGERDRVEGQRKAAAEEAANLGLPRNPEGLKDQASRMGKWEDQTAAMETWRVGRVARTDQVTRARQALVHALRGRGVTVDADAPEALSRYREACRSREEQADLAARRPDLEERLQARRLLESKAKQAAQQIRAAEDAVDRACSGAAVTAPLFSERVAGLEEWLVARNASRQAEEQRRNSWTERTTLLDGSSEDELREEVERLRQAAGAEPKDIFRRLGDPDPDLEDQLREARKRRDGMAAEAGQKRGEATGRRNRILDVADVEEDYDRALTELNRLEAFDGTLDRTLDFLKRAEDKIHRDVAPRLKKAVEKRLPAVTAGRYSEVRVDPENLEVQVRTPGAGWQPAKALSHGTVEQIYLLLRVALVESVTKESCPILLDDVTVHSDRGRTHGMMNALKAAAEDHQVIVFSQEEEVLNWAREQLDEPLHGLIELEAPA